MAAANVLNSQKTYSQNFWLSKKILAFNLSPFERQQVCFFI